MPISEDEFNQYSNDSIPSSTMSKAELRKTHKPIMEKRRRAKINNCLNEIKDLILAAMKKDPERHSKLEKADILEMAVKYLKNVQKQQREVAVRSDPAVAQKYKSGFVECAEEVTSYVNQMDGLDPGLKQRLNAHLVNCANGIEQKKPQFSYTPSSSLLASFAQNRFSKDDHNNNPHIQGIELIPSCLPSGEFAFLVPKSFSSIISSQMSEDRPSAFVTVKPQTADSLLKISKPLSPPISPELSPRGFQPIIPKATRQEIQNIRFPINPIKKESISEPLCIITNQSERFRQAQMLGDTQNCEENVYHGSGKRRVREEGLLTLAPPNKMFKLDCEPSTSRRNDVNNDDDDDDDQGKSESMWRPW
ncbi:PREDICTED: protein deadpan-like [Nicrophorus vespilloides]|uniref:Protein deadpan-like n=1 Tax=Nicrophorus vespilloides TaxID=110193 RepID=A0ABM1NH34_NICVS|nr:PREDICTED: protein deadpan-like [Nicrophorus vespilloides]